MKIRRAAGIGKTSIQDVFYDAQGYSVLKQFNATIGMNDVAKLQTELLPQWKTSFFANIPFGFTPHDQWDLMSFKSGFLLFLGKEEGKPFWQMLSSKRTKRDEILQMQGMVFENGLQLERLRSDIAKVQSVLEATTTLAVNLAEQARKQSEQIAMLSAQERETRVLVGGLMENQAEEEEEDDNDDAIDEHPEDDIH